MAYISGDIKIVSVDSEQKNDRLKYELKISYPQIHKPRTPQEWKFNVHVRRLVQNEANSFRKFCSRSRKYPNGKERKQDYYFATHYEVHYATRELLSIELTEESFTGYLNTDWYTEPLNYDLKAGRFLALADVFNRKRAFLKTISSYCVNELTSRDSNCTGGEEWLRKGTEPKARNYRGWHLTRDGVQITFGEYQVGPGCLGLPGVLVPYEHLRPLLRKDRKWFDQ